MYNSSCDYAQKIQEKNAEILREIGISCKFYTNFLVNADLFWQISLTRLFKRLIPYYETEIPSLLRILLDFVLTDTTYLTWLTRNLINMIFPQNQGLLCVKEYDYLDHDSSTRDLDY